MSTSPTQTSRRRIAGGSQAEDHADNANSSVINIVRPGVEWLIPSDKKVGLQIRIKPSLDYRLPDGDPNFPLSWRSYRDRSSQDETTGLPVFTEWFSMPRVYRYFGNSSLHFVSPSTRPEGVGYSEADRADPLNHIRAFCKKPQNKHLEYLIEKPEKKEGEKFQKAVVGRPESIALYNVLAAWQDEPTPIDAVTFVTMGGHKHVKDQMDAQRPASIPQDSPLMDPLWPEFLLGDPTDPNRGYWAAFRKYQVGNGGAKPWCPLWSSRPGFLDQTGLRRQPLTEAQMRKRWDITSEDVIWIESYQRLVEIIIGDGAIPRDVVAHACGHMCSIPGGGAPQATFQSAQTGGMFAPPTPEEDQIPGLSPSSLGMTAPFGTPVGSEAAGQTFGAPGQAFGAPGQQFGAPAPAQQFGAPGQQFGAPAPAPAPAQQFGAPGQQFGAPAGAPMGQPFGAPGQQFGAPAPAPAPTSPQFGAPGQQFGAPGQSFGAPAVGQQFGAPAPAPAQQFGAPGQQFGQPAAGQPFGAPGQQFGQPLTGFAPAPVSSPMGGTPMPTAAPGQAPFAQPQMSAPAYTPPPVAAPPPPPAYTPPPPAELFWVVIGGQPQSDKMTLAEAQQKEATHLATVGPPTGSWQPIADVIRNSQASQPQAAQAAAPAADGPLSAAESADLDSLTARASTPDTAKAMSDPEIQRLGLLQMRKQRFGVAQ